MVKLTRESKRILYLAASIVSFVFMLFFAWTLVQYFFAPTSSTSAQEAPTAQGQTVVGASGTQTDSQTSQTQGSSSSDTQSNADASKTQDSSNQKTSEPSNSGNSTNAVAADPSTVTLTESALFSLRLMDLQLRDLHLL